MGCPASVCNSNMTFADLLKINLKIWRKKKKKKKKKLCYIFPRNTIIYNQSVHLKITEK